MTRPGSVFILSRRQGRYESHDVYPSRMLSFLCTDVRVAYSPILLVAFIPIESFVVFHNRGHSMEIRPPTLMAIATRLTRIALSTRLRV